MVSRWRKHRELGHSEVAPIHFAVFVLSAHSLRTRHVGGTFNWQLESLSDPFKMLGMKGKWKITEEVCSSVGS